MNAEMKAYYERISAGESHETSRQYSIDRLADAIREQLRADGFDADTVFAALKGALSLAVMAKRLATNPGAVSPYDVGMACMRLAHRADGDPDRFRGETRDQDDDAPVPPASYAIVHAGAMQLGAFAEPATAEAFRAKAATLGYALDITQVPHIPIGGEVPKIG